MLRFTGEPANNMTNLQQQITVHALPSKVWKVLTSPDYTNQYLSEGNLHSDWTEGSFRKKWNAAGKSRKMTGLSREETTTMAYIQK